MAIDVLERDDLPFPRSLPEFQRLFPDEAACAAYLEHARWSDGFVCHHCGVTDEPYRFANRPGVLRCRHSQIRRYESSEPQPTLEVIRKLAIALSVSADMLIFDRDERGPDDDLRLQFEALSQFSPEEEKIAKTLLESLILRHDASRFSAA